MRHWTLICLLMASALAGCSSTEPTQAAHPLAASTFTWDPSFPFVGEEIRFEAQPRTSIEGDELQGIRWSMDGVNMEGWRPTHIFTTPGEHQVQMQVRSAQGGDFVATKTLTVISEGTVSPDAPGRPVIHVVVDDLSVDFAFTWGATAEQVFWDFGDGTNSTDDRPTHEFAPGTYTTTLRVAAGEHVGEAQRSVTVVAAEGVSLAEPAAPGPRVVVGVTDSGINPYHEVYYRPDATEHPCTYVTGYEDCDVPALSLTVGPDGGSYGERMAADRDEWSKVGSGKWYWIPQTNLIAVHCPTGGSSEGGLCILDDESTHGTGTTSSVLTEAPDALLVFNEGSDSGQLATSPVPLDIESNSWGSLAPLYAGLVNGPTGAQVCHDSIDAPTSLKFRSAGNNGPVPNMGDCWRNGYRAYSVGGGYPDGSHSESSGSAPDFESYWCRPVAATKTVDAWRNACGTSFAAPTAAGTAAAALLKIRRELEYTGGSTTTEVAPGITHEAFMDAVIMAATYDPETRSGYPSGGLNGPVASATPWYWWGWGWLDAQVTQQVVDCALGRDCPDNKSAEAWAFNDVRRGFASDGEP